jgi:iron complex outermembrane receptor protein
MTLIGGFGDLAKDRFNVMGMVTYQKDEALFGSERDFSRTSIRLDENNFGGSSRSEPANISIPTFGVFNPVLLTPPGPGRPAFFFSEPCGPRGSFVPDFNPNICVFDTGPFVTLIPKTERTGLLFSGKFALSKAVELFADVSYTKKEAQTVIQPAPIDAAFGIPFNLASTSPFYPTAFVQSVTGGATPTIGVRYRPFIIGNRDLTDTAENTRVVAGLQGNLGGWDYDGSFMYNISEVTEKLNGGFFRINDDASGPGIVPLLNTGLLNPFGPNNATITAQARATNFIGTAFSTETTLTGLQGKASKDLLQLAGGGFALALGGDVRNETYKLTSNPALATGNISGYGGNFAPVDADRTLSAVFAEISAPVLKTITFDAAVRFDAYGSTDNPNAGNAAAATTQLGTLTSVNNDTLSAGQIAGIVSGASGSADSTSKATFKLGSRWNVSKEVLLRATYGTGFRAPSLFELYGPLQSTVTAVVNDPARCQGANAGNPNDCATQFNSIQGGRATLKSETSSTFTIGAVFEPADWLSFGVDYYNLKVENLMGIQSASYMLANEGQFAGRIFRGPADGLGTAGPIIAMDQRTENLGKAYITGLEFDARARGGATPYGRFGLNWTASYQMKWDQQQADGSYTNEIAKTSLTVLGLIPRLRMNTTLTWQVASVTAALTHNWQASFEDVCGNFLQDEFGNCPAGSNPKRGTYEIYDLQLRYDVSKRISALFGVKNLFDKRPPYVNGSGGAFQSGYDPTYVDPRLRFMYLTGTFKFF